MVSKLKWLFFCYIISCLFFAGILSAGIIMEKYRASLSETLNGLQIVRENLVRMVDAVNEMEISISEAKRAISPDFMTRQHEELIFIALDGLKTRIKDAEITVTDMEYKDNEINLPVNIKASLRDYTSFVNDIGYLDSLSVPFFSISNISILQSQYRDAASVMYEIKGILRVPRIT